MVFNGQIGPKNIQAEVKITNKEFHIRHTICESVKPCINLSISSSFSDVDWKHFTHNLLVTVDLRKLGFAHEFNLKADTKRDGYKIYHTLDTHIQSADQNKYQYNVYVNPTTAGIVLSLPKRTSAIEAVFKYPDDFFGHYQATITSYLDKKNNPSKYSTIGFEGELKKHGKYSFKSSGTLTASHPSVKELKISGETVFDGSTQTVGGQVKFDVFKHTNQAIVIAARYANTDAISKGFNLTSELSLKSTGLGLNYIYNGNGGVSFTRRELSFLSEFIGPTNKERFGIYLHGCQKGITLSLVVLDDELLKASALLDAEKKSVSVDSKVKLLGSEPITSKAVASFNGANAHIKHGNFLSIDAEAVAGKALTFKAVGNQKPLVDIKIALDQSNLFSTNYNVDDKEFKDFLVVIQFSKKKNQKNKNK